MIIQWLSYLKFLFKAIFVQKSLNYYGKNNNLPLDSPKGSPPTAKIFNKILKYFTKIFFQYFFLFSNFAGFLKCKE